MMIWLGKFIISNYKLASSPPKDPGGIKNIFSNQRTLIHRIFSVKAKLSDPFPKEWYLYFHSLCSICHKKLCIFLQLDQLVSRSVYPRPLNLIFANSLYTQGRLLIIFPILLPMHMFVLLVSDHVGLVVCLEQAPGLRTNKYADSAFGVHVEVEYLLGLLSVADLNSLHPKLRTCCRCRVCGKIPWSIVTVAAEMVYLGGKFSKDKWLKTLAPSGVQPFPHKSEELAWE